LGCSGGGGSADSNDKEVSAPIDRSTVSQLSPLVLSITNDAPTNVAVDSPNYYELGINASATNLDGNIHFFYGNKELHHRYFDGKEWIEEIIDDSSKVGSNATVVLDDNGEFHILYQDLFSVSDPVQGDYLKYAHGTTGNWTIKVTPLSSETLDEHRGTVALNSRGDLYFAHLVGYDLVLSKYSEGVWSQELAVEDVNRVSSSGLNSVITMILDDDDIPHIFYTNTWQKDIAHATKIAGEWVVQTLADGESNSNLFSSATLDEAGDLNVCFSMGTPARIYCSELNGGTWTTELIGSDPIHSYLPTLKIDETGFSHLVYYVSNDDSTSVRYASNKTGTWQFSTFELSAVWRPSLDNPISLEVSNTGDISIFLISLAGTGGVKDELLMVNYNGVSWSETVINHLDDERAASGEASTIKISALGSVEIVYPADSIDGYDSLKVATLNDVDEWGRVEPISNFVPYVPLNVHVAPDMEIDAEGKMHIISASHNYSPVFYGITYFTNKTGEWQQELIPNTSFSNKYDLVLGEDGSAHVVYFFDAINNQVRYVTNQSGSWVDELVYDFPNSETDRYKSSQLALALKVKEEGGVQIAMYQPFRDADPIKGLLSASKVGNSWNVSSVLEPRDVPARFITSLYGGRPFYVGWSYPSLAIDGNDTLHMTYNASECNTITCAPIGIGYSNNDAGIWRHKIIDGEVYYLEEGGRPEDPSFSIAENGDVYIVYYHGAYEEIRLSNVDGCAHNYVVIDREMSTLPSGNNYSISASLDTSSSAVHVSYHDNPNGYLKYAEVSKAQLTSNCQGDKVSWVQKDQEIGVRSITIRNDSTEDQRIESVAMYDHVSFEIITDECLGNVIAVNESCSISVELDSNKKAFYSNSISLDVLNMQNKVIKTIGINFKAEVY
jgi:hypothetical protein